MKRHAVFGPTITLHHDPRRPGRLMLRVPCTCGRVSFLSHEEARRKSVAALHLCPEAECGRGAE